MRLKILFTGIIIVILVVVALFILRDVAKLNDKVSIGERKSESISPTIVQPPSELFIPTTVAGEKRLLLRATVDHVTTEEKHGVISMLLRGRSSPVIVLTAQLGPTEYKHLVRFQTPHMINQKQVNSKTFPVKELLSFLTKDKEIQLEIGFAQGTDELETFQKSFNSYIEKMKVDNSNTQPFVIIYPFIKGIEFL